jgi:hypothetical protein
MVEIAREGNTIDDTKLIGIGNMADLTGYEVGGNVLHLMSFGGQKDRAMAHGIHSNEVIVREGMLRKLVEVPVFRGDVRCRPALNPLALPHHLRGDHLRRQNVEFAAPRRLV